MLFHLLILLSFSKVNGIDIYELENLMKHLNFKNPLMLIDLFDLKPIEKHTLFKKFNVANQSICIARNFNTSQRIFENNVVVFPMVKLQNLTYLNRLKPWLFIKKDLHEDSVMSRIDQEIYTLKGYLLYESYYYKSYKKERILGKINASKRFDWFDDYDKNMADRRAKLGNMTINAMTLTYAHHSMIKSYWKDLVKESNQIPETFEVQLTTHQ